MSDLMIYGEIGYDVSAADTVAAIRSTEGALTVRLNTPGGSVFDGLAIATHLRARGNVTTMIDGIAASIGSIIYIAGSRRIMAPGTLLMIHNPSSGAWGNADDLRSEAGVLDVIAGEMAKIYAEASGGKLDEKQCLAMMDAETWLTPEQAVEYGFCHEIAGTAQAFAKLTKRTAYQHAPKEMQMENEQKGGLFDRLVARITVNPDAEITARIDSMTAELATLRTEYAEASAALVDAAAKIAAKDEEIVSIRSAHAAEVEKINKENAEAIEAKAKEIVSRVMAESAPAPLSHVEPEPRRSALEEYERLQIEGTDAERFSFFQAHKAEIENARKSGKE